MKKIWQLTYKGHKIRVENSWFGGEKLFVDEELQDEQIGLATSRARLYGRIKNGDGENEQIKVSIGGNLAICCRIFINDTLVLPCRE